MLLSVFIGGSMSSGGQVLINEFVAWNESGITDPDFSRSTDWIELRNSGPSTAILEGYFLTDDVTNLNKWVFPSGTSMPSGSFLLVWADGTNHAGQALHTGFKLNVGGEFLALVHPSGQILDSVTFRRQFADRSYGRGSDGKWYYFSPPSPKSENYQANAYEIAIGIVFDPPAGFYSGSQTVTLNSHVPGATIRYTTDGSEPGINSTLYTSGLVVDKTTVIRARVYATGYRDGWAETSTYLINESSTLPVFSLSTKPANLWDNQIGIYVTGTNGITGYCSDVPRNYNQDWERPFSVEYYTSAGKRILQQDAGVKIFGGCSRGFSMKSLALYSRNEYGSDEFRYHFFREKPAIDRYKDLVLRNSGNDFYSTLIRDAAMQAVVKGLMDLDFQAYEPSRVYINGEYWGIHNIREKLNEHYIESNYDIPAETVDFLENNRKVLNGSATHYNNLLSYLQNNDLYTQARYDYVRTQMDVDEYIDYLIVQMFFVNTDWPGNNLKYWRPQTPDGRWRWIIYDLDFGLGLYTDRSQPSTDMFTFSTQSSHQNWPNPAWSTFLFRKLLQNQHFRDAFIQRFSMHLNTTFRPDRVAHIIDSIKAGIQPEFQRHINRWNSLSGLAAWDQKVDYLKSFASARPAYVWDHMRNFFGLGSTVDVKVMTSDINSGKVMVNGIVVENSFFSGKFHSGTKQSLQALPAPGFQLSAWEVSDLQVVQDAMVPVQSVWKYLDNGIYPGDNWKNPGFSDAAWKSGQGVFGFGDGGESTLLNYGDPGNKYISYYFRKSVNIPDLLVYDKFILRVMRDDGAVIYVNGKEALRTNMPSGTITMNTPALATVGGSDETYYYEYELPVSTFSAGANLLAAELHQISGTSSDARFDLVLVGVRSQGTNPRTFPTGELNLAISGNLLVKAKFEPRNTKPKLFINEFMASNLSSKADEYGEYDDWIEIFNAGTDPVNMAGYFITDNFNRPQKWQIIGAYPEKTTIPGLGYLLFFADDDSTTQGPLHLNFKLAKEGEEIGIGGIINNQFTWFDTLSYRMQQTDISFGRYPDGSSLTYAMVHYTPGRSNNLTSVSQVPSGDGIQIYPNPAGDEVFIGMEPGTGDLSVEIYDLTGSLRFRGRYTDPGTEITIGISSMQPGLYLVRIVADGKAETKRLVKR